MREQIVLLPEPFGFIRISAVSKQLVGVELLATDEKAKAHQATSSGDPVLREAVKQMLHYLAEPEVGFSLPLKLSGTPYQRRVWQALREIPVGQAISYGELAHRMKSGAQAVAAACKSNRFPVIIPCHRVISATGLGGYCGQTNGPMLEIKRWLLRHEGSLAGGKAVDGA